MKNEMYTFPDMQADYRLWDHAHSIWRIDNEGWRGEHETALLQLAKLHQVVRQHGKSLESHAQAIEDHQKDLRDQDRAMSEYQNQGEPLQETMVSKHLELAERYKMQHKAHERIKKHHHSVMAHVMMLRAAIEAAM